MLQLIVATLKGDLEWRGDVDSKPRVYFADIGGWFSVRFYPDTQVLECYDPNQGNDAIFSVTHKQEAPFLEALPMAIRGYYDQRRAQSEQRQERLKKFCDEICSSLTPEGRAKSRA